jgi:hypothetical protein
MGEGESARGGEGKIISSIAPGVSLFRVCLGNRSTRVLCISTSAQAAKKAAESVYKIKAVKAERVFFITDLLTEGGGISCIHSR